MSAFLSLENVSKSYGSLKVTDDLTFSLKEGEALGVIGPNGAGKTTMFNLITGDVSSGCRIGDFRRRRNHQPVTVRTLPGGHRSLLSDTASIFGHDSV